MLKRIISFILTILLVVSDVPWTVIASGTDKTNSSPEAITLTEQEGSDDDDFYQSQEFNDATAKGTTGDCIWALYGTELVISGKGAMANYSKTATLPWGNSITKVTIGAQVTDIGEYAFRGCTKLTSVEIPDSVNSIGFGAFSGCSGLTSITIPFVGNSRKKATDDGQCPFGYIFGTSSYTGGVEVFQYHYKDGPGQGLGLIYYIPKGLQSVTITDGKILPEAFKNCSMLTSVKTPDDTTSVGSSAFSGCTNLTSIELGSNLTEINSNAFKNCKNMMSFVVPDGVTYIGTSAFEGCSLLTNITIPDSIDYIGPSAFESCYNLAYNKYKNGCYLGNSNNPYLYLVDVDSTNITEFVTHEDTRVVGWYVFSECSNLTSVKITDKVTRICTYAFMNCSKLSSVSMGNGINRIDRAAFINCSNLTSISIPNSVIYIGNNAFSGCNSLEYYQYNNANYLGNETNPCLILVEVTNKYINTFTFHKDTRFILDYAFENCTKLTNIVIPEHIVYIGSGAFTGCSSLVSMTVPFAGQTKETDDEFMNVFATLFRGNSGDGFYSVQYRSGSSSTQCYVPNSLRSVTVTGGEILPGAFYGCKSLTEIILPAGITSIGAKAFFICEKLTGIVIPDSVTSIGADVFAWSGITKITIPAGMSRIDAYAFQNSSALVSVVISHGVSVIDDNAFEGCTSLKKVAIPDSVTVIGKEAFSNCSSLTNIVIPNSVVSIGEAVFYRCEALQSITLPFVGESRKTESDSYQYPFGYIFGGEISSDGVATEQKYYGSSISSITSTTYYIPYDLKKVTITGGNILRGAFENCTNLTTIVLGEGITEIGEYAFSNCTNLKNITIPNSIVNIQDYAFSNCTNLKNITIPNSIVDIQDYAFSGCSLNYYSDGVGYYLGNNENPYLVLADTVATNMTSFNIRKETKVILDHAFYNCNSLTSITLPEGIKRIGTYTFSGCSKLSAVTIPDSVTVIGTSAFNGCSKLTSIRIPKNVSSIGGNAFQSCTGLTRVEAPDLEAWCLISFGSSTANPVSRSKNLYINGKLLTSLVIPASISRIESYAFSNCTSLTSISLHNNVTHIGTEAFAGCGNLTNLTIPNSVKTIEGGALARCSKLQSLTIPFVGRSRDTDKTQYPFGYIFGSNGYTGGTSTSQTYYSAASSSQSVTYYIPTTLKSVTVTGGNTLRGAFRNCKNLTEINIPDNITELGTYSFYGCSSLKKITIPKGITVLGDYVFYNCSSLTDISVPDTVVSFGKYVFYNCIGLKNISIPVGVTSIGDYAFQKCTGLTEVIVPNSVESIGANAFNGCSELHSISIPFVGQSRKTDTDKNQYPFGYIFGSTSYTGGTSTRQYYYGSNLSTTTSSNYYIPTKLKKVTLTDGNLTYGAFYDCKNLITIVIGDGVHNISKSAFIGTDGLEQFEVSKRNPNYCSVNRILYNKDQTEIIWVPGNHTYLFQVNYIYANGDSAFASINQKKKAGTSYSVAIPEILGYSTRIDSISGTMPADDLVIDVIYYENDRLIYGECNDSISWTLYNDGILVLRGIGEMPNYESGGAPWAAYADKVQMIYIDARITSIGSYAFEGCRNMTFIDYGYSIKTIGEYAFSGCSSLTSFKLPDSVSAISKGAFFGCTGLKNVVIADYITSVADNAFMGCGELIQVTIGGAVSEIGNNAFADCDKLTQVYFRGKPVTLGNNAFGSTSGKYVYYYSTAAGWDDVITDGLWHGYIAVPYNAIVKENFTGTNIYIIKVVDKHNAPLANAVVNLGGKVQSTNADGMAYYVKPEEAQKLTVSCSNHITFEDDTFLATNSQLMDIIELSDKPSTVQGIRLNNQSIATSIVVLNCAESKTVTITVSGYSKYTITKYELYQGNRLITTNKTSASNCTFQVAASAFEEGETVLVRMHTADGNMVATALNIDVVKLASIAKDQVIAELSDVNIGASLGGFGNLNFKIPFSLHGAENITVYTEGRSIFVGINLDVIDLFSRKVSKKKIQEAIDYTIDGGVDGWPSRNVDVEICGFLEIEYFGNGEYHIMSSYVKMRVALWLESEIHASFYGIVGVYFKVRFGAAGELELQISRFDPEKGFGLDQLDLSLENMLELEGGVFLLWGIGSVGVFGNLTLGFTVGMVPTTEIKEVYVTGDLGIRWAVAWGLLNGEKSLGPKDIYRWPEESSVFMVRLFAAKQDPNSYTENDRSYLEDRSHWLSEEQSDGYLQKNIYDNVAPKVVTCDKTTVMVWLDDNPQRDNSNFQMLYYSVYNNGAWSAPMAVCDNGTFDCEFDVYTDGKKIYIIYTEMKDKLPATQTLDITDLTSIEDLVVGVEVNVIVYENGKFGTPVRLTNNSICEQLPTITEVDGKITASWLESNALGLEIETSDSSVITVVLGDKGWSNPVTLVNGQNSISDITTGSLQDNSYTAYIVDADGVGSTTDDQVLVLCLEDGDSIQLDAGAISNVTFTNITGIPVLTWYNNGKIYMISDVAHKPVSLVPENVSAGIDYQIVSVSEEQTLLFFTMKNYDQNKKAIDGTDIYGTFIDCNGALSSPVRMTKTEGFVTSYSIYVQNEELFAVFTETFANVYEKGLETVTHFRTATLEFRCDIIIETMEYDISNAHPSSDFNISFRVTNSGTNPVDYITLYFYDHLGTLLYTTDCDIVLLAGESADCEATIILPQNISTQAYMVEILPRSKMGIVEDSDPANNRVDLMLAYTDMSICAEQKIIGEKNYIIFSVSNEGNMASTAMLKVYAEGRLISELEINAINPGSTEQYLIDIHALTSETDRILTCVVLSEFTDPYTLNNTDSVYLMHIENETFTADPEKTIRNPELSTNVAEFDKYTAKDIILEITAEADSFVSIENLTLNVDYIINNDFVTISSVYLATLKEGIHTLNFIFDFGNNSFTVRSLTVTITDTTPIALTGSVSISGEYVVGGTVSADLSKLTPNTSSILYIWSVDGETVGTDSCYTIRSLDYGKTLTLTVTATDGFAGTFTVETFVTLRKPGAPNTPVISRVESTSFTLVRVEGIEYSLDGIVWQDSNVFDNLQPNQDYTVYARRKSTEISLAGDSSAGVTVTTLKATRTAPTAPELQGRSYNMIILVPNESMEYKIEGGEWTDNNIFSDLQSNTTYVFYQRFKETNYTYASDASTASFTTEDSATITGSLVSFGATDGNVTIKLMQNGVEMASVVTTGSTYELTFAVPEGVYQLVVSKQNHVTRTYELEVTGNNIIQDVKIHLIGDINGDGKANAVDKKLIYNHMNDGDKALVGYAFRVADINSDGKVNAIDKKMIYNHMNDATKNLW